MSGPPAVIPTHQSIYHTAKILVTHESVMSTVSKRTDLELQKIDSNFPQTANTLINYYGVITLITFNSTMKYYY